MDITFTFDDFLGGGGEGKHDYLEFFIIPENKNSQTFCTYYVSDSLSIYLSSLQTNVDHSVVMLESSEI